LRQGAVIHGAQHLETPGGAILLGFHLGPPRTPYVLQACGYPVTSAGRLEGAGADPRWHDAIDAGAAVRLPDGSPADWVQGLNRLRGLLRKGSVIYLTADGPFGREAFRIDLPGRPLVVRAGWLALRRLSGAPTFPVLTHRHRGHRVIVVHPPLPAPQPDPVRDAESCRLALAPIVLDYVRRFPAQCRYLAFPAWPPDPGVRA
jgi:lauroyl/myristoyl acyltransferase